MTEKVNRPSKKRQSDQRTFIEKLIESLAVKSISFRSIIHPLFRDMIQLMKPDFSAPVSSAPKPHIKGLADLYRQLPERQEKGYCSLMVDGAKIVGFLNDKDETEAMAALNRRDVDRLNEWLAAFARFVKSAEGNSVSHFDIFPMFRS
jgi:hypothetical protein